MSESSHSWALTPSARKQDYIVLKETSKQPDPLVTPNPKLEKHSRRVFTAEYKLKIIQQADAHKHGEPAHMLRREKLYANQLADWRREYVENGLARLDKSNPGPVASKFSMHRQIEKLEKQVARLKGDLDIANDFLISKTVVSILDRSSSGSTQ